MLSANTISIVKSTAPVLQQHGETLTRHFYQRMFAHNPEVVPFFNSANQQAGRQQQALAAAICAYAANIDNLEVLGNAVELIAQKHASLLVKPEHYPIVGENLLASISEVLGDGASEEVLNAWAEAYGLLADILIGREQQIYGEQREAEHGWQGFAPFKVIRKELESEQITSFYLEPEAGGELPLFKPGQYITLRVATADGLTTMRNYSLSDKPGQPYYRISVKRELGTAANAPDGYVSHYLHSDVQEGSTVEIAPPCGEFFLDRYGKQPRPLVLLAGGVGVTPLMSMLLNALETDPQRPVVFIHCCANQAAQAFGEKVRELADRHANLTVHFRYSEPVTTYSGDQANQQLDDISFGLIDAAILDSLVVERDAEYYFCGPQPFMASIHQQLQTWEVPPAQIHFEFFGPLQAVS